VAGEYPAHWRAMVEAAVTPRRAALDAAWVGAVAGDPPAALESRLRPLLEAVATDVLGRLYPPRG
jgi:hypothetical protein